MNTKTPLQLATELQALQTLEDGQSLSGMHHRAIRRRLTSELLQALHNEELSANLDSLLKDMAQAVDAPAGVRLSDVVAFRVGANGVEPMQVAGQAPAKEQKQIVVDVAARFCPQHDHEECAVTIGAAKPVIFHRNLNNESVAAFEQRIIAAFEHKAVKAVLAAEFADLNRKWNELKQSGAVSGMGAEIGSSSTVH